MPIYEYRCNKCGKITEALQKFSDAPLSDCNCGGQGTLNKLISRSSFQLKGGGWYITDYKNKDKVGKELSKSTKSTSTPAKKD